MTQVSRKRSAPPKGNSVLVVDIGGSSVKLLRSGASKPRQFTSGSTMTPSDFVQELKKVCQGWNFDRVSIGYPGKVGAEGPQSEPLSLGPGWVGFDFATALGKPVRIFNDAAMQALGSYDGGRMLFLGLGTGLGSMLILKDVVIPLELGELCGTRKRKIGEVLGDAGRKRLGNRRWRKELIRLVSRLGAAFNVDYVVLGGGNAKRIRELPAHVRIGNNVAAFRGGVRLWSCEEIDTHNGHTARTEVKRQITIL
jgi:predicted NBD/HSP70 family sugar kinase